MIHIDNWAEKSFDKILTFKSFKFVQTYLFYLYYYPYVYTHIDR